MDRTQDSDSWGVGSIPAGCISPFYMEDCMKDILDKIKKIYEDKVLPFIKKISEKLKLKELWDKVAPFLKEQKRYIGVAGLFVVFVLFLVFFTGEDFNAERIAMQNSVQVSGADYVPDAEFEVDEYPAVNELIKEYFEAYVAADFATLETIVSPLSEMEKSYITTMSPFYEAYQNIKCYTKHGLSKDSYIVSACFDIKFKDQAVTAPSMVLFYVQTNEDGSLYINNLYSDFNMKYTELAINKEVFTALRKYTTQDDYLELFNQVESAFSKLIKENNEIYQLTKRTIPGTRQEWEDNVFYAEKQDSQVKDEATEGTEESEGTEEQETLVEKVKIEADINVRVRSGAGTDYTKIGDVNNGEVYVKLGSETGADGREWIKIQFTEELVGYVIADCTVPVTE